MQRAAQLTGMGERALLSELGRQLTAPPHGARGDLPRGPRTNPALPPPRAGWPSALEVFERALMAILLRHGGAPYSDGLHPDHDGERAPLRVVDYVRRELDRDTLHFQTLPLRELYNRYLQMPDDARDDFARTLQREANYQLLGEAIELWTGYELSRRWRELGEGNGAAAEDIAREAHRVVHTYKAQVLERRCEAVRARLNEEQGLEQRVSLLRELGELNTLRRRYYEVTHRLMPSGRVGGARGERNGGAGVS